METRVSELRHEIVRTVKDPLVLQYLTPAFISEDDACALKRLYHVYKERANHRLLDLLYQSEQPGKWTAFLEALQEAEYTHLANLLQTEDKKTFNTCSKLIELFVPQLEQRLNPAELLAALYSEKVISFHDREIVMTKQTNEGAISAAMLLLERIQLHLEPDEWYSKFLTILHLNNEKELANLIDPDFDVKYKQKRTEKETLQYNTWNLEPGDVYTTPLDDEEDGPESLGDNIQTCRDEIAAIIPDIAQHLVPTVISQEMASQLLKQDTVDPRTSSDEVIDYIISSPPSVHREFHRCLESEGYQYLASLLLDPNCKCHGKYMRKVVTLFEPTLQQRIDPADMLALLVSDEIIGNRDRDSILKTREQRGKTAAAMLMLQCVQSRRAPHEWYTRLLQILVQTDNTEVVKILEPDFLEDADKFTKKLYEEVRQAAATPRVKPGESESPSVIVGASMIKLQKQKQAFVQSVDKARADFMEQKRKIDNIYEKELHEFEFTVKSQIQKFDESFTRIQHQEQGMERQTCTGVIAGCGDGDLLTNDEDGKIINFKAGKSFTSFGEFHLTNHVEEQSGQILSPGLRHQIPNVNKVIPKWLQEDSSSGSSYLDVSDRQLKLSDKGSSAGNQDEIRAELRDMIRHGRVEEYCNVNTYVSESKYRNVYIEILRYNVTIDTHSLMCCDIAATQTGKDFVGLSLKNKSFCRFDSVANLMNETPLGKQYHKLMRVTENEFIVININDLDVHMINMTTKQVRNLDCNCRYEKKVLCAAEKEVCILCSGKHIHVFSCESSIWLDPVQLTGTSLPDRWTPIEASINRDRSRLFIAEAMNLVHCFNFESGKLIYSDTWCDSHEGMFMMRGLVCIDDFVLVVDSYKGCVDVRTADNWLYKDSIEHEAFSACKLVSKGSTTNELIVVSERKTEEVDLDNHVTHSSMFRDNIVSTDVRKNATHGNRGILTINTDFRRSPDALKLYPDKPTYKNNDNQRHVNHEKTFKSKATCTRTDTNASKIGFAPTISTDSIGDGDEEVHAPNSACSSRPGRSTAIEDVVYFIEISLVS